MTKQRKQTVPTHSDSHVRYCQFQFQIKVLGKTCANATTNTLERDVIWLKANYKDTETKLFDDVLTLF